MPTKIIKQKEVFCTKAQYEVWKTAGTLEENVIYNYEEDYQTASQVITAITNQKASQTVFGTAKIYLDGDVLNIDTE